MIENNSIQEVHQVRGFVPWEAKQSLLSKRCASLKN